MHKKPYKAVEVSLLTLAMAVQVWITSLPCALCFRYTLQHANNALSLAYNAASLSWNVAVLRTCRALCTKV